MLNLSGSDSSDSSDKLSNFFSDLSQLSNFFSQWAIINDFGGFWKFCAFFWWFWSQNVDQSYRYFGWLNFCVPKVSLDLRLSKQNVSSDRIWKDHNMWIKATSDRLNFCAVKVSSDLRLSKPKVTVVRIGSEMITKCELRMTQFLCLKS